MSAEILRRAAADIREDVAGMGRTAGDFLPAVADWLDMQAGCITNYGPNADSPWVKPNTDMALAVARAYLGENA